MDRSECLHRLRQAAPAVLPSLLLCDFGNLRAEIERLEAAGVPALHLDVMDGLFVPNLTYGMPIVAAVRRLTKLPLDVHLMIERPERYLAAFVEAGADVVTVHVEACREPGEVLATIRRLGACAGLALNPATPLNTLERHLTACDLALVMSVPAGFGGQAFDRGALERLEILRRQGPDDLLLEVDGGVNRETIGDAAAAGAQLFVVGSGIFRADDYGSAVDELTGLARRATTRD